MTANEREGESTRLFAWARETFSARRRSRRRSRTRRSARSSSVRSVSNSSSPQRAFRTSIVNRPRTSREARTARSREKRDAESGTNCSRSGSPGALRGAPGRAGARHSAHLEAFLRLESRARGRVAPCSSSARGSRGPDDDGEVLRFGSAIDRGGDRFTGESGARPRISRNRGDGPGALR